MAHWAQVNESNIVVKVLVGNNDEPDEGYQTIVDALGGTWIKTSYNGNIRKNFAGVGMTYDPELDAFIHQQPYPSWTLDTETFQWVSPVPKPDDGKDYLWNEAEQNWVSPLD